MKDLGSERTLVHFLALSGILGCVALLLYFAGPFVFFPFPSADASNTTVTSNATHYATYYYLAAWLQVVGTFLVVAFLLGLVYLLEAWNRFSGWLVLLTCSAILMLSLLEGTFFVDAAQAVGNGHPDAAVTSFDLTFVFLRTFFLVPSPLLALAFVLRGDQLLPRGFRMASLVLGAAFAVEGAVGLFYPLLPVVIAILLGLVVWVVAAALGLEVRLARGATPALSTPPSPG